MNLDFKKIKTFLHQRTPSRKEKYDQQNEMIYFQITYLTQDLNPVYRKNFYNSAVETNNPV